MPTYNYECKKCEHKFEVMQRMVDDPLKVCPECGDELKKVIVASVAGFQLKGKGWFKDGY